MPSDETRQVNRALFNQLSELLSQIGLTGLFDYRNGRPSGWLWSKITSGEIDNEVRLITEVEETEAFKNRYGIILEQRRQAAAGQPVQVLTMQEVRATETQMANVMRANGLPSYLYDNYEDLQRLMRQGLSPKEVEDRVMVAWTRVQESPPEVREEFNRFYGIRNGDKALAAFLLDPDKTAAELDRQARTAYAAGIGKSMGVDITRRQANEIAGRNLADQTVLAGMNQAAGMANLTVETISEAANLTAADTVDATLLGDADAATSIERRTIGRQANAGGAVGGALYGNAGVAGLTRD